MASLEWLKVIGAFSNESTTFNLSKEAILSLLLARGGCIRCDHLPIATVVIMIKVCYIQSVV